MQTPYGDDKIEAIRQITNPGGVINKLLDIWESSVRPTHTFLSEEDIQAIKPEVAQGVSAVELLYGYYKGDMLLGFMGIEGQKIEMLFIDAASRGQGIGRRLLNYALDSLNAVYVDVNEQNGQGVGFYLHMGFRVMSRSELDEQGRPFPLLHLEKANGR